METEICRHVNNTMPALKLDQNQPESESIKKNKKQRKNAICSSYGKNATKRCDNELLILMDNLYGNFLGRLWERKSWNILSQVDRFTERVTVEDSETTLSTAFNHSMEYY